MSLQGPLYGKDELSPQFSIPPGSKDAPSSAPEAAVFPMDDHNTTLVSNVHPEDYVNPEPLESYDLVVIGAGVAGLLSVIMTHGLGLTCCLIERHYMGGDCLNIGCVPSKVLLSSSKAVKKIQDAAKLGVHAGDVSVDFPFIMERMRRVRAEISVHDSVERYGRDFCDHVFLGDAHFSSEDTVTVQGKHGERVLRFRKAMIATGASAFVPPIPGLVEAPHLTNANFYNLTALPPRMLVIGAGPIGLEMAQAMRRFGSDVTVFEASSQLLVREDPQAASLLQEALERDGIQIVLGAKITSIEYEERDSAQSEGPLYQAPWPLYTVHLEDGSSFQAEALLNATGRAPNVHNLGLDAVNVEYDARTGVHTDPFFCTTNPRIYACGDCTSVFKFTHAADWQARIAIRNAFLGDKTPQSALLVPWCTYTDPEVAHVGKYEAELEREGIPFESFVRPLCLVDRCRCDGVEEGFVKITVRSEVDATSPFGRMSDQILGATIVGSSAGDLISELTVCMQQGIGCASLAGTMHPYPTTAESIRQCAAQYNKYLRTDVVNEVVQALIEEQKAKEQEEEKEN